MHRYVNRKMKREVAVMLERDALERGEARVIGSGAGQHLQRSQSNELLETLVHPDDRESVGSPPESPTEDSDMFDGWMPFDFGVGGNKQPGSRSSRPTSQISVDVGGIGSGSGGGSGGGGGSAAAVGAGGHRSRSTDMSDVWSSVADGDIAEHGAVRVVKETTL
jgi:hypothetical protein